MWTARLERRCGRNTEQESIVKDAVSLHQENGSSLSKSPISWYVQQVCLFSACQIYNSEIPCNKIHFPVFLQWALYKCFIRDIKYDIKCHQETWVFQFVICFCTLHIWMKNTKKMIKIKLNGNGNMFSLFWVCNVSCHFYLYGQFCLQKMKWQIKCK